MSAQPAQLDVFRGWPPGFRALLEVDRLVANGVLDATLMNLVKIRASQINGCEFCLDMHTRAALATGEDAQRIDNLPTWNSSDLYDDAERAALAVTETLTALRPEGIDPDLLSSARLALGELGATQLLYVIALINTWNRLVIGSQLNTGVARENAKPT